MNPSEEHIIERICNGHTQDYALLIHRYKAMAFSIAFRITGNREDAEEVAQDAFLKSFKAINSFKGGSKFSTWLYRIVYTTAISKTRNFKKVYSDLAASEVQGDTEEDTSFPVSQAERKKFLQLALEQLPAEEAIIVSLYYYEEKTVEEISEITHNSRSNVKVKLFRARKRMHDVLCKELKTEAREIL